MTQWVRLGQRLQLWLRFDPWPKEQGGGGGGGGKPCQCLKLCFKTISCQFSLERGDKNSKWISHFSTCLSAIDFCCVFKGYFGLRVHFISSSVLLGGKLKTACFRASVVLPQNLNLCALFTVLPWFPMSKREN